MPLERTHFNISDTICGKLEVKILLLKHIITLDLYESKFQHVNLIAHRVIVPHQSCRIGNLFSKYGHIYCLSYHHSEETQELRRQINSLQDMNTSYTQQTLDLEEQLRRMKAKLSQVDVYRKKVATIYIVI